MKRELRFCACGWSVFGTDEERLIAMASHRKSEEHKRWMVESVPADFDNDERRAEES